MNTKKLIIKLVKKKTKKIKFVSWNERTEHLCKSIRKNKKLMEIEA